MQIYDCDGELGKVEARLSHFDVELSTVNKEIQSLEEDSDRLSVMLRNRMAAASSLGHWLQDTTVPPGLIHAVREGDISDAEGYSKTLRTLQAKVDNMHAFVGQEKLQAYPTLQVRMWLRGPSPPGRCSARVM
jgi:septal ring factor EnvC (AmiA/AmiB activator)